MGQGLSEKGFISSLLAKYSIYSYMQSRAEGVPSARDDRSFYFFYCQSATSTHFLKNAFSSSVLFAVCVAATMGRILST